ncbi:MAG: hydroxymethylglutaryl-CoA lyase [Phycisphaerales bacterium]|nr:hydroxymethylglutaryl-CoA lyase [Phycisphaerales bacterium]
MALPQSIRITEVGPRDGLQNEKAIVDVDQKIAFIDMLSVSGVPEIEVTSFVNPSWVPQMADASEVCSRINRAPGVLYSALVPNERGLHAALESQVDKVAIFTAASEAFSQQNTNATIDETFQRFLPVVKQAREAGLPIRAYVSCVVKCPYEGAINPKSVLQVVQRLIDLGVDEIDLGETLGVAHPDEIEQLINIVGECVNPNCLTLHLHDTEGRALACVERALTLGVWQFDAACGGLGGCPFAPGAAGNLATEQLVSFAQELGLETNIDVSVIAKAGLFIASSLAQ